MRWDHHQMRRGRIGTKRKEVMRAIGIEINQSRKREYSI